MKSATGRVPTAGVFPDYLLPFYLTATVRDKRKEMSGEPDRDYHDAIVAAPSKIYRVSISTASSIASLQLYFTITPHFYWYITEVTGISHGEKYTINCREASTHLLLFLYFVP